MNATLGILVSANTQQAQQGLNQLNTSLNNTTRSTTNLQNAVSSFGGGVQSFNSALNTTNVTLGNTAPAANSAASSIGNLQRNVSAFGGGVRSTTTTINTLGRSIQNLSVVSSATAPPINNLSSNLQRSTTQSNQATQSLINLGRVAQDAPYGFLGIANNLNPLLESFQRLRATTGSNATALSALGGALTGPAGIGLALSVVSSLLISFGDALFGAGQKAKQAKIETETLAISLGTLSDELDRLRDRTGFEADIEKLKLELSGLTGPALEAAKALVDINKNNKDIATGTDAIAPRVKELDRLRSSAQSVVDRYDDLSDRIKTNKNLFAEQLKEKGPSTAILDRISVLEKEQSAITNLANVYRAVLKDISAGGKGNVSETLLGKLTDKEQEKVKQFIELSKTVKSEGEKIQTSQDNIEKAEIRRQIANNEAAKKAQEKALEEMKRVIAKAKALSSEFKGAISIKFDPFPLDSLALQFKQAEKFISDFTSGKFKIVLPVTPVLDIGVPEAAEGKINLKDIFRDGFPGAKRDELSKAFADQLSATESVSPEIGKRLTELLAGGAEKIDFTLINALINQKVFDQIKPEFRKFGNVTPDINFGLSPTDFLEQLKKKLKEVGAEFQRIETIANGVSAAFGNAFEALLDGQNPIKAIASALKALIADLVRAAIQSLIFKAITKSFFPGATTGIGSAIGALSIFGGARAEGGPVSAGKGYIVGEKRAEWFVPKTDGYIFPEVPKFNMPRMSGNVIPNGKFGGISGVMGQLQAIQIYGTLSGKDILLSNSRQGRYNNRNV